MDESRQWAEFGRWLAEQREQKGLRRRDAARRAKVTEAVWRDLENGRKEVIGGIRLLPNPSRAVLERVAVALDVPLEDVLARTGRPSTNHRPSPPVAEGERPVDIGSPTLAAKVRRLSERDRLVVERLVEAMLELQADEARPFG